MTVEIDYKAVEAAFKARDAKAFAAAIAPLGTDLTLERIAARLEPIARHSRIDACGRVCIEALAAAATGEVGIALERGSWYEKLIVAAVRVERRVVLSVIELRFDQRNGWASIPRWYRDLAKNRPTMEAWAAAPERATDAIQIELGAVAAAPSRSERELLAAVTADPKDVAARIVYADALVERGDPRGEWIHAAMTQPRNSELDKRTRELASVCERPLFESLHGAVQLSQRGGFIYEVTLSIAQLSKHGAEIFATHPIERLTVICSAAHHLRSLVKLPIPAHVELIVCGDPMVGKREPRPIDVTELEMLAFFATRRALGFQYATGKPAMWAKLFAALPETRSLVFDRCKVMPAVLPLLASSMPALERLRIAERDACRSTLVPDAALRVLGKKLRSYGDAGWSNPKRITDAYAALFSSSQLEELELPDVRHPPTNDALETFFVGCTGARTLRTLIGNPTAVMLRSKHLATLEEIRFTYTIPDDVEELLRERRYPRIFRYDVPYTIA